MGDGKGRGKAMAIGYLPRGGRVAMAGKIKGQKGNRQSIFSVSVLQSHDRTVPLI